MTPHYWRFCRVYVVAWHFMIGCLDGWREPIDWWSMHCWGRSLIRICPMTTGLPSIDQLRLMDGCVSVRGAAPPPPHRLLVQHSSPVSRSRPGGHPTLLHLVSLSSLLLLLVLLGGGHAAGATTSAAFLQRAWTGSSSSSPRVHTTTAISAKGKGGGVGMGREELKNALVAEGLEEILAARAVEAADKAVSTWETQVGWDMTCPHRRARQSVP